MRTLLLIFVVLAMSCTKADERSNEFLGIWKTDNLGGVANELSITEVDSETILLYGAISAKVTGSTFESDAVNTVTHTGELANGILRYCQSSGATSVCGDYTKE